MTDFAYEHRTVTYPDGTHADVYTARIPAEHLRFSATKHTDWHARLRDAAHLRYVKRRALGEPDPVIVAWACLEPDTSVEALFPGMTAITDSGEHVLSANAWITYVLRRLLTRGELRWRVDSWDVALRDSSDAEWRTTARAIIEWLSADDRLRLEVGPERRPPESLRFEDFAAARDLVPVRRCGFVRDIAATDRPRLVFNSSFFLLEPDDFISHHSALGDPYGLRVEAERIVRPPLYPRAAIWHTPDMGWHAGRLGMRDVALALPGGMMLQPAPSENANGLRFHVNPSTGQDVALYTRSWGVATQRRVLGRTPESPGRFEITIIDTRLMSWQRGGGLLIPQNGVVVSFAPDVLAADALQALQQFGQVTYRFTHPDHQAIDRAIQCGPLLLRDGQNVLNADSLDAEEFWISRVIDGRYVVGSVPSEFPDDTNRTRAGRVGLGVNAAGDLVLVLVPGISKAATLTASDSAGATLAELAAHLLAAGAVGAINLDGGGSTQAFVDGGLLVRQGDTRGYLGAVFDRMVPTVGMVIPPEPLSKCQ